MSGAPRIHRRSDKRPSLLRTVFRTFLVSIAVVLVGYLAGVALGHVLL